MLEVKTIRENPDLVIDALKKRGIDPSDDIRQICASDATRRESQAKFDEITSSIKALSDQIGQAFRDGNKELAEQLKQKVADKKEEQSLFQEQMNSAGEAVKSILFQMPNMPDTLVPSGRSEKDNEVYKDWVSALPEAGGAQLPHWELAEQFGLVDFETGAKITGSGFPLYKGSGARLQRALISFFLDEAVNAGFTEVIPPYLVNEASAMGTGQLPDKEGQMYHITADNLYLIPTAEVPVTNILRDVILSEDEMPVKYAAYTPCFRREAGSYGKDVRGLNRVHQFDKVEIVQVTTVESSDAALMEMLEHVESLLEKLNLPYRILRLCGGDLGFSASITYDFEVWSAAQKRWLEVSSVSNFKTFQSNRMSLRYRDKDRKTQLAHTLNGSALALARIYAALLENNQYEGGIKIPEVLLPYTGFLNIK